ncbi:MAG: hypothetical protein BWY93_00529 [Euryarchaeota archaeon ADurb.BinA087]|nr:MAG: hypothetical protein BWY93_00529 [Euryarchaeota archaeon ADurb.BinA087]
MKGKYQYLMIAMALVCAMVGIATATTVTQSITYQGILTDSSGNPLTGSYSVLFSLYDVASGGSALGTDTRTVDCTNGLFTTPVTFDSSFFDGRALWLGVKVGSDPEMSPRQEIRPVPYALSIRPNAWITEEGTNYALNLLKSTNSGGALNVVTNGNSNNGVLVSTAGDDSLAIWGRVTGASSWAVYGTAYHESTAGVVGEAKGPGSVGVIGTASNASSQGVRATTSGSNSPGIKVETTGPGSYGILIDTYNNASPGVLAQTHNNNSNALFGATSGSSSYGVYGIASADSVCGVAGSTTGNGSVGVWGNAEGSDAQGVRATTSGKNSPGVMAKSTGTSSPAVYAESAKDDGVYSYGLKNGVVGKSGDGPGVPFYAGVYGESVYSPGVWGKSTSAQGVLAQSTSYTGAEGISESGFGILGSSWSNDGVHGVTNSGSGVYGESSSGLGVHGVSTSNSGVYGESSSGLGVYGHSSSGNGVYGESLSGYGVVGYSPSVGSIGVEGVGEYGVWAESRLAGGTGLLAKAPNSSLGGKAAVFYGNVVIRSRSTEAVLLELGEGLDYSEGFNVSQNIEITPGTVLVIDDQNLGTLTVSNESYDRKVAGIVAGANGIGSAVRVGGDQFDYDVALAGRVYCNVDTMYGAIEPGDLLTTSPTPGYAMVVKDHTRAQGAILGKAMERMEEGQQGQILVLVTLQ